MKAGWEYRTLGDVCETIIAGGDVPKGRVSQERTPQYGVPIYSNGAKNEGLYGFTDVASVMKPSITISARGTIGYAAVRTEPFLPVVRLIVLIPDEKIVDISFLYYSVAGIDFENTGTSIPQLTVPNLRERQIYIPPLPEQRRIVVILDEAFEGIATAKANAEKNLHNARALFESHLQSVFSQRGEGWVEKRLSDVCAITSKLIDPRKEKYLDLIHVGAGNIVSQSGVFTDLKTAREEGLISGKFLFDETMVLYSKIRPYLMKVARPDFDGLCSADMYPLTPLPNEITRDYLFHLLMSKHFTDYAIQGSARAGMPKVNREHLFEFTVWLPSMGQQNKLAAKLDALQEETQRLESICQQKLDALDALKKSLLDQAFRGELSRIP